MFASFDLEKLSPAKMVSKDDEILINLSRVVRWQGGDGDGDGDGGGWSSKQVHMMALDKL